MLKKGSSPLKWFILPLFFLIMSAAMAKSSINLTPGVTPLSKDIYELHMIIFWICVAIGVIVFGVLTYSLIRHRKSIGAKPAQFHEHPSLEVVWAVVPFIILVAMAIPATKVLIRMKDTREADVTVKVTGYQWKWQYEYLNEGIRFFSNLATPLSQIHNKTKKDEWYLLEVDNPVVLPVNKKIRFLVTSNDVLHSWWVPSLGVKRDAIPGYIHESWAIIEKPGVYRGQCTELCGVNHAYMPIVVKAVSEKAYEAWVSKERGEKEAQAAANGKTYTRDELMDMGKQAYDKYCAACHKEDGTGMPPVFPALKASSISVSKPISRHIKLILNGVPGTAMQAFGAQLSDLEIAAITTYERNAWENNTGDVVQPDDVKKAREGSGG